MQREIERDKERGPDRERERERVRQRRATDRAAILADAVGETAVALGSDLDVVGSLQQEGLLQVARGLVHVGNAVLAVVGEVLGRLVGHQTHEGQLDVDILRIGAIAAILELQSEKQGGKHLMVHTQK